MIPVPETAAGVYSARRSAQGPRPTTSVVAANSQPMSQQPVYAAQQQGSDPMAAAMIAQILMRGAAARPMVRRNIATEPPLRQGR